MKRIEFGCADGIEVRGMLYLQGPVEYAQEPEGVRSLLENDPTIHTVVVIRDLDNRKNCGNIWYRIPEAAATERGEGRGLYGCRGRSR